MTFRTFHLIMLFGALCSSACGGDRNPSNISNGPGGFVNPDTWDVSFGSSDGSSPATDSAPQDSSPDLSSGTTDTLQDFDDSGHSDTTHEPDVAEHLDGSSSMDTVATLSAAPDGALGAHLDESTLTVRVFSAHATRVELWLYQDPTGEARWARALTSSGDIWSGVAPLSEIREVLGEGTIYYGYRAWGPNWPWVAEWTPGSVEGFLTDVDAFGNRFNPNKLALDPYAREVSHDPWTPSHHDGRTYASGEHRAVDSGPVAPKGIVLPMPEAAPERVAAPERAFRDEVIYEVHLRGLTRNDPSVPEAWRGTYRGAAERAAWLRSLGVTAIELLPLHDTPNDRNDVEEGADGDNYWGYSSLSYFAPDRRYAADTRPGGPTREFKAMVDAFHAEGLKVYVDVVYNHTAEGGTWDASGQTAMLLSWRALDNATYYQVHDAGRRYQNNNGVGPNVGVRHPATQTMILDSLRYWHRVLGVDGFRFDLAPILGNDCHGGCFRYNNTDSLLTAIADLARPADGGPGVDLIAEPWGIGEGTYQMGNFPLGWAE
ncbi:MAG: alpha-amylase family glycosyl hydrolase, partial [Myxococcota bacterium]